MADLLTLTCPTCGGSLQVTNDVDHFVCMHCGNTHVVDPGRRVESLAAEVEKLQTESAIQRLQKQIQDLKQKRSQLGAEIGSSQAAVQFEMLLYRGVGIIAFLEAFQALGEVVYHLTGQRYGTAILALGATIVLVAVGLKAMRQKAVFHKNAPDDLVKRIPELDRRIAQLQHELDREQRHLVSSDSIG